MTCIDEDERNNHALCKSCAHLVKPAFDGAFFYLYTLIIK